MTKDKLTKLEEVRKLRRQSVKTKDICKQVGISSATMYKWLQAKPVRVKRKSSVKASETTIKLNSIIDIAKLNIPESARFAAIKAIVSL